VLYIALSCFVYTCLVLIRQCFVCGCVVVVSVHVLSCLVLFCFVSPDLVLSYLGCDLFYISCSVSLPLFVCPPHPPTLSYPFLPFCLTVDLSSLLGCLSVTSCLGLPPVSCLGCLSSVLFPSLYPSLSHVCLPPLFFFSLSVSFSLSLFSSLSFSLSVSVPCVCLCSGPCLACLSFTFVFALVSCPALLYPRLCLYFFISCLGLRYPA
jgi:hypothetical protein